jgi:hypothetical protein
VISLSNVQYLVVTLFGIPLKSNNTLPSPECFVLQQNFLALLLCPVVPTLSFNTNMEL